jgi:hypothetical protein
MKRCRECKIEKSLTEFGKNKSRPDGRYSMCKDCRNVYAKSWYLAHRKEHIARVKKSKEANRRNNRQKVYSYLMTHGCIDCGITNPVVLDFDHVTGIKHASVSQMMDDTWSNIELEISKCVVRCSNCHRIRTSIQFGWYKDLVIKS